MKKRLLLVTASIFLVLSLAFLSGCSQSKPETSPSTPTTVKPIELKMQVLYPSGHYVPAFTEDWAKKVEQNTGGKVKIKILPNGALAPGPTSHEALVNGVMDINLTAANYTPDKFPLTASLTRSLLGASGPDSSRIVRELFKKYPEIQKEFAGTHVVAIWASSGQDFITKSPVKSLTDLKGQRLRATNDIVPYVKSWGADPVSVGGDEVVVSLQKGVIDGTIMPGEMIPVLKLQEVAKYTTAVQLFRGIIFIAVNQKTWDSLPDDAQKAIDGLAGWYSEEISKTADEKAEGAYKWAKENGGEILFLSPEDNEALISGIKKMNESIIGDLQAKGLPAKAVMDDINQSLKK